MTTRNGGLQKKNIRQEIVKLPAPGADIHPKFERLALEFREEQANKPVISSKSATYEKRVKAGAFRRIIIYLCLGWLAWQGLQALAHGSSSFEHPAVHTTLTPLTEQERYQATVAALTTAGATYIPRPTTTATVQAAVTATTAARR